MPRQISPLELFASAERFQLQFLDGLFGIIHNPDVTPSQVVLVLNNAIALQHKVLFDQASVAAATVLGRPPAGSAEDCRRLRHLLNHAHPFDIIKVRSTRGGIQLVHNVLRASRPMREASTAVPENVILHKPFNPEKFNFLGLAAERFALFTWGDHEIGLYYNKFPYDKWNFMLVPDVDAQREQFLTRELLELVQQLTHLITRALPDCVSGYNSLLARASVNQLHVHVLATGRAGLKRGRPDLATTGIGLTEAESANRLWPALDTLQQANQPFNLLDSGWLQLAARRDQGSDGHPLWNTGPGFMEVLVRRWIVTDRASFRTITDDLIHDALCCLAPSSADAA